MEHSLYVQDTHRYIRTYYTYYYKYRKITTALLLVIYQNSDLCVRMYTQFQVIHLMLFTSDAIQLDTPILLPRLPNQDIDTAVFMMDEGGGLLSLPFDLRVSF